MHFSTQTHIENMRVLLFILTGEQRGIPKSLRKPKIHIKRKQAAFITSKKPEVLQSPARKTRTHPANPYINERAVQRRDARYRSHSHQIQDIASVAGIRVMKNGKATKSTGFNQPPCHRPIQPDEVPNVGPQPMRK